MTRALVITILVAASLGITYLALFCGDPRRRP